MKPNPKTIKVSVCITTLNETKETIKKLLDALNNQTLKPDEIIIIDAKDYNNCSRSKGRNIAIKKAKNDVVAITDAGCIPHKNWLLNLCSKFKKDDVEKLVVAGVYQMIATNNLERAESLFLGVSSKDIKNDFLPSARSMAFTRSIWKRAGGFPEGLHDTAEDTLFNVNLIKAGAKFIIAKNAIVDWEIPKTIYDFASKIYGYSKGDVESGIWWHPTKKWKTHNIKVLTIFGRYLLFLMFPWLVFIYILYAFYKAGLWGIILQFISDFAAMSGFLSGIIK